MLLLFSIRAENEATVARPPCSCPLNRQSWVSQVISALSADSPSLKACQFPNKIIPSKSPERTIRRVKRSAPTRLSG